MVDIYRQYKEQLNYILFGGLTTVVNIAIYFVCFQVLDVSNVNSNVLAWIASVTFAYVTNRLWVFQSKAKSSKEIICEITAFVACRLFTGMLDIVIMYISVDLLSVNAFLMKIATNIMVIIFNYVASRIIIFKK